MSSRISKDRIDIKDSAYGALLDRDLISQFTNKDQNNQVSRFTQRLKKPKNQYNSAMSSLSQLSFNKSTRYPQQQKHRETPLTQFQIKSENSSRIFSNVQQEIIGGQRVLSHQNRMRLISEPSQLDIRISCVSPLIQRDLSTKQVKLSNFHNVLTAAESGGQIKLSTQIGDSQKQINFYQT